MARALTRALAERARLRSRAPRLADHCGSGRNRADRAAAPGRSPAVSGRLSHVFCHFPVTSGRMVKFPVSRKSSRAAPGGGGRGEPWRPDGIPLSSPTERAASSAGSPSHWDRRVTTTVIALALPILIGLGARWSATAALDDLTATNARLTVENENYREATGQLSSQISRAAGRRRRNRRHRRRRPRGQPRDGKPAGRRQVPRDGRRRCRARSSAAPSAPATQPSPSCATSSAPSRTGSTRCEPASNAGGRSPTPRRPSGRSRAGSRRRSATAAIPSPAAATSIPASTSRPTAASRSSPRRSAPSTWLAGTAATATWSSSTTATASSRSTATCRASRVMHGQQVNRGDVIGFVGSTGRSTSPHLHYEIWVNGKLTNPMQLLASPLGTLWLPPSGGSDVRSLAQRCIFSPTEVPLARS